MKICKTPPAFCSGCHRQQFDKRHVDFEAYYDGPVIDPGNGIKQCIDDLVLCETCLTVAAQHLGMIPADEDLIAQIEKQKKELGELRAYRARTARRNAAIEKALAAA